MVVRASAITLSILFVVCTSVFTAEFQSIEIAGLTWSIDRAILLILLGNVAIGWWQGKHRLDTWQYVDCLILAFLAWLALRTFTQPLESIAPHQPNTLMHMVNGYCIPFILYAILRTSKPNSRQLRSAMWIIAIFGIYLSATAIFEVAKMWSWVFPKFIADSELGIHFGRARGPMLQSVRLGTCLLACWIATVVFTVWRNPYSKWNWIVAISSLPVYWTAIALTYTRSIWLGLCLAVALLVVLCLQGRVRRALVVGGCMAGVILISVMGASLVSFKREYTAAETRQSTYMRSAFAYVSLQMIQDRPLAGFGFNQFNAANRPYLSDRSTSLQLESIRGYVHHNSYLSLFVELGLVGFVLYMAILAGLTRQAWTLWCDRTRETWHRGIALTTICLVGVHLIQMAFHEVSFSAIENSVLFSAFGLTIAVKRLKLPDGIRGGADGEALFTEASP